MKVYKKYDLVPNLSQIVAPDDADLALKRGCDDLMALAEYVLRDRPWALRNAREVYLTTCFRLYRAVEKAHQL